MSMKETRTQREQDKFKESEDGDTTVRVSVVDGIEISELPPDDTTLNNPAYGLSYDGSGNLQYIDMVISDGTYRKTLTYATGKLSTISEWVEE